MIFLGFDVGGTKIEGAVIQLGEEGEFDILSHKPNLKKAKILARMRTATERESGYDNIIQNFVSLTNSVLKEAGCKLEDIEAIGMGLPGAVHPRTQKFLSGNTLIFKNRFIAHDVAQALRFQKPYYTENDANCFALAEGLCGAGLQHMRLAEKDFKETIGIGVILGTGCGGGVLVNGHLLRGKQGGGAELGHTMLKSNGHPCFCGSSGCAEQYLSGPALEAAFMRRRYSRIQNVTTSHEIFELCEQGEPVAMAVIQRFKSNLSSFLGNLATVFDPDYFVLGGGLSDQDVIYKGLSKRLGDKTFLKGDDIPVYKSLMGSSSGVIGAGLLPVLKELTH